MKNPEIRNLSRSRRPRAAGALDFAAYVRCWCLLAAAAAFIVASCSLDVDTAGTGSANPNPGIIVEADNADSKVLVTTERGGTDRFHVRLADKPRDGVVLSVTGLDLTEARVTPESLIFDQDNWDTEQTVTVTGVDDQELDGSQNFGVTLDISQSADEAYSGLGTAWLPVVNVDNDGPGVTAIDGVMEFWEHGGQGYFWVVLNTAPDDTVVLQVGCTDASEALISAGGSPPGETAALQFTPSNWSTPRRVNLTGVDDNEMDGNRIFDISVTVDAGATWDSTGYLAVAPVSVSVKVKDGETRNADVYMARSCGQ